jgi:hypothetical protein
MCRRFGLFFGLIDTACFHALPLQLVCDDLILEARCQMFLLRQAAAKINGEEDGATQVYLEDSTSFTIQSLHFAFNEIRGQLNLFAQLAQSLPGSVNSRSHCRAVIARQCQTKVANGRSVEMVCYCLLDCSNYKTDYITIHFLLGIINLQ